MSRLLKSGLIVFGIGVAGLVVSANIDDPAGPCTLSPSLGAFLLSGCCAVAGLALSAAAEAADFVRRERRRAK